MLASQIIVVSIHRSFTDVYDFCADPLNFSRWGSLPDSIMEPLGGSEYLVDLPQGRKVMRFAPFNSYGVLDYQVYPSGSHTGPVTPVRLVRNGEGCDLQITWFQKDGVPDEQFRSEVEWIRSDLQRLKTLLEGG